MKNKPWANRATRTRRGFTLIELIAVLAILGILASLAIPAIGDMNKKLKSTELDAVARQIFIAAQNRTTAMLSMGTLESVDAARPANNGGKPSDFPTGPDANIEWSEYQKNFVYVYDMNGAQQLLPPGAIEDRVRQNHYFIEYNKETGEIYGVFYAEHDFAYPGNLDALRTDKAARMNAPDGVIGYYGGAATMLVETGRTPTPRFALVNDEELYVSVLAPKDNTTYFLTVGDATTTTAQPLVFSFTTADVDQPLTRVSGPEGVALTLRQDDKNNLRVVLDSLGTGLHFGELFAQTDFKPGDDLAVSLTALLNEKTDTGELYVESDKAFAQANSLFGYVDAGTGADPDTLGVYRGRHLQNLEKSVSGYAPDNTLNVKQTDAIDWAFWNDYQDGETKGVSLRAITNDRIDALDGQGNSIGNLTITAADPDSPDAADNAEQYAGVFGVFRGSVIKGVRLYNATLNAQDVPANEAVYVGLLAGKTEGTPKISDVLAFSSDGKTDDAACKIYASNTTQYVGGLIGAMAGGTLTDSAASLSAITVASDGATRPATRYTGGLLGQSKNVTVQRCYADTGALSVTDGDQGQDYIGGFAGHMQGGTVQNCYALGVLSVPKAQKNKTLLAGFACADDTSLATAYAATTYAEAHLDATVYGFTNTDVTGLCYFLRTDHVTDIQATATGGAISYPNGTPLSYDALAAEPLRAALGTQWQAANESLTHPYKQEDVLYPFPILKDGAQVQQAIPHYGDWPGYESIQYLAYFEKYNTDGMVEYGFYDGSETKLVNTIDDGDADDAGRAAHRNIVGDGYAILRRADDARDGDAYVYYYAANGERRMATLKKSEVVITATDPADGRERAYAIYFFDTALTEDSRAQAPTGQTLPRFFHSYSCGGYSLFCNPCFGESAVNGADVVPTDDQVDHINIRTPRHLKRLGEEAQRGYWSKTFQQRHAVDGLYAPPTESDITPIGISSMAFTGSYEGNRYEIANMRIQAGSDTHAGLFGFVQNSQAGPCRLADIRLVNADVSGGTTYAGALVGQAMGSSSTGVSIERCYVYARPASTNSPGTFDPTTVRCTLSSNAGTIGGLIGAASGCTIQGSLASLTEITATGTNGGGVGGFAGYLENTASVKQCYTDNTLLRANTRPTVGGFVGVNKAPITDAYALGEISCRYSPSGFVAANNAQLTSCYSASTYSTATTDNTKVDTTGYGFCPNTASTGINNNPHSVATALYVRCNYLAFETQQMANTVATGRTSGELAGLSSTLGASWASASVDKTHPYDVNLANLAYPFPALLTSSVDIHHYGNWPVVAATRDTELVYWEKYNDGTTAGLFGYGMANVRDTADNFLPLRDDLPVLEDGYAILRRSSVNTIAFGVYLKNDLLPTLAVSNSDFDSAVRIGATSYQVFHLGLNGGKLDGSFYYRNASTEIMEMWKSTTQAENQNQGQGNRINSFYYHLRVVAAGSNTGNFYFNPGFAKTVRGANSMNGPGTVEIRTARQLYALGAAERAVYQYWGYNTKQSNGAIEADVNIDYSQTRDIDFGSYDYSFYGDRQLPDLQPIGRHLTTPHARNYPFRAGYDGNGHRITGLTMTSTDAYCGLFGLNQSALDNVTLISSDGAMIPGGNGYTGALVGHNDAAGSIDNCAVAGFTVFGTVNANAAVGGLVGRNDGSIEKSAAVCYTSNTTGGGVTTIGAGGFVGHQAAGSITNCYAMATMTGTSSFGFVGSGGDGITDCYCAATDGLGNWLGFGRSNPTCLAYDGTATGTDRSYDKIRPDDTRDPAHAYPFDASLVECLWPAVVTRNSVLAHYGNWPAPPTAFLKGQDPAPVEAQEFIEPVPAAPVEEVPDDTDDVEQPVPSGGTVETE